MTESEEEISVGTPHDIAVIKENWIIALRPSMEVPQRHLKLLGNADDLVAFPAGAALRVVSNVQYEDETFRVRGYSIKNGSLAQFDESELQVPTFHQFFVQSTRPRVLAVPR